MMDNNHHSSAAFAPNQAFSPQHQEQMNGDWSQYSNGYDYSMDNTQSMQQQPQYFQFPQPVYQDSMNGKGPMTQLLSQIHPASHVRAYNPASSKMPSRSGANPIQVRKERSKQSQPAKRQKISPPAHPKGHSRCNSAAESIVSECCSSCPDTPPCDESDCCDEDECEMQAVAVVPCYEEACAKPVCSNPCLTAGINAVSINSPPAQTRTTNWLESQWIPSVSQGMTSGHNMQAVVNGDFDLQYNSTSASPVPTTPSMVHNMDTPYSPHNALPTPQYGGFPAILPFSQSNIMLSTSGNTYNHAEWPNYSNNSHHVTNCLWNGCQDQQYFTSDAQWISHLHNSHIDPQMSFGCPVQGEACPPTLPTDPLDHLQTAHGYNYDFTDFNNSGFSCPAPACLPDQTFSSHTMFHNHFDHVHGTPAQGSLECRLEACNTTFVDPQDLIKHISQHHHLPVALPKEDTVLSVSAETASILASLPTAGLKASVSPTSTPAPEFAGDFSNKSTIHACKWNDGDDICGQTCTSEESLQKHIKHEHLEQLDKQSGYKCLWEGCGRDSKRGEKAGFTQRGKLERHMATHTGCKCLLISKSSSFGRFRVNDVNSQMLCLR